MISNYSIICLIITAVLLFILPVAASVYWKRKNGSEVSWKPLIIGAIGFIITVRVLELLVHVLCLMIDSPISRFINGNNAVYVLYGILMAGIFEEVGRYVIIRFIMKKNKTPKNMVMYGIGHGGIEVWAVTLPAIITYLAVALIMNSNSTEQAMTMLGITASNMSGFEPVLTAVKDFGALSAIAFIIERIFAMTFHISLTLVVFEAVRESNKKYLLLAVALHALFDLFPAMGQRGLVPTWLTEIWLLIWAVGIGYYAFKLYKKQLVESGSSS